MTLPVLKAEEVDEALRVWYGTFAEIVPLTFHPLSLSHSRDLFRNRAVTVGLGANDLIARSYLVSQCVLNCSLYLLKETKML